jgi:hypothetical protein
MQKKGGDLPINEYSYMISINKAINLVVPEQNIHPNLSDVDSCDIDTDNDLIIKLYCSEVS